jgi:hypothetical protein
VDKDITLTLKILKQLSVPGGVAQLCRAVKEHECNKCRSPMNKGELYYCIYIAGIGLDNLNNPFREYNNA